MRGVSGAFRRAFSAVVEADIVRAGLVKFKGAGGSLADSRPAPSLFAMPGLTSMPVWGSAGDVSALGHAALAQSIRALEAQADVVLAEYDASVAEGVRRGAAVDDYARDEHVLHGGEWRWLSFVTKGERREALRAPKTRTLLDAVPRLMTGVPFGFAFYSSLQPGAEIAPHTAPMNLRLRVHIALRVPPGDCALRVAGETHTWRPSEALVFDDAYVHSAWNRTDQERVLLLFDVWHPDLKDDEIAAITDMFRRAAADRAAAA